MKINISDNIRKYRKERGLTQERLAEILGVTVGAVSKWESGATVPDIGLILEMADFFEISTDVLLGYDKQTKSMEDIIANIKKLRNEKNFDASSAEAEKALERYPNNFDITFHSAVMYCMEGIEKSSKKAYQRALTLFERSLTLISQNTNEHINEWSIKNHIANVYQCLGQTDKALEQLKKNNVDSLNDGLIGYTISTVLNKPEEALPYLSDALTTHVTEIFRIMAGYINAYEDKKDFKAAREASEFMLTILNGLRKPPVTCYYDKLAVKLFTTMATLSVLEYDNESAKSYLIQARDTARHFDSDPASDFTATRFHHGTTPSTAFDDFGDTAVVGIEHDISEQDKKVSDVLYEIWKGIKNEFN